MRPIKVGSTHVPKQQKTITITGLLNYLDSWSIVVLWMLQKLLAVSARHLVWQKLPGVSVTGINNWEHDHYGDNKFHHLVHDVEAADFFQQVEAQLMQRLD